jgi:hypothetical protein
MFGVKLTSPRYERHFVRYVVLYITVISIQVRIDGRLLSAVFLAPCSFHLSPVLRTHAPLKSKQDFGLLNTHV